jgi:single-strand selective monofunctional uracil DNA glycosylase
VKSSCASDIIDATRRLSTRLEGIAKPALADRVYHPLEYAWQPHEQYLRRFGSGKKRVLFLGMNPGPFGMAQTGIPFGEIAAVRDWLGIEAPVGRPGNEHPKRPIEGFACRRSEVSGRRLWGLFAERFGSAERFFAEHFVLNYCPLLWLGTSGANLTPDKFAAREMEPVESACMEFLTAVVSLLRPQFLIGIGGFAAQRLRTAAATAAPKALVAQILHPSPASPAANRGWAAAATKQLHDAGVWSLTK